MLVVVVFASAAHANSDVLVERDSTIYGKITQVSDREVSIARLAERFVAGQRLKWNLAARLRTGGQSAHGEPPPPCDGVSLR